MLGITLTKDCTGREYHHLYLTIYFKDDYKWEQLLSITWQSCQTFNDWYGFRFNGAEFSWKSLYRDFVKVHNKILKADMYDVSPQTFIEWFLSLRGTKFLVNDTRLDKIRTLEEWESDKDLSPFKIMWGNRYFAPILAWNKEDATKRALKFLADNHEWRKLEQWQGMGHIENSYATTPVVQTIDEILETQWE